VRPITREYIRAWIVRAERDYQIARSNRETGYYDACVVFCQQAVEKLLKAYYLVRLKQEPRKTHKIVELAQQLGLPYGLVDDLHDLESDYIQARYPESFFGGPGIPYDEDVADDRLNIAKQAMAWIREKLAQEMPDE